MKENTLISIVCTAGLSVVIALLTYLLLIHFAVDVDLQKSRENNILNFYELNHEGDIFILGSSAVNEGIDANLIEKALQANHINLSVYNLGISSDRPLERVTELDNLIESRPEMVVLTTSYYSLSDIHDFPGSDDRLALISQRISISNNADMQALFNADQQNLLTQNPYENALYKRKFLISKLISMNFLPKVEDTRSAIFATNFKDPWVITHQMTEAEKVEYLKLKKHVKYFTPIFDESNPQTKALQYIITKLQNNNIRVILISLPIVPQYSSMVNESTRSNLSIFLNSTGVPWYDCEREYPSPKFLDPWHLNAAGRRAFSQKVAEILADHLTKGD